MKKKGFKSSSLEVLWAYDLQENLKRNFSNRQWADLSRYVIDQQVLRLLDRGISPIAGGRKLWKYSESYKAAIRGQIKFFTNKKTNGVFYIKPEGQLKTDPETGAVYTPLNRKGQVQRESFEAGLGFNKNVSPVNLTLSGSMLSHYDTRAGTDIFSITVGIHKDAPEFDKLKAKVHNEGTDKIPARRFVPLKGENFTAKITLEIRKLFAYCLDQALKRGRNK